MLQASMEHDHVEGDALADSRGMGIVAHVPALVFHIRRFIPVAVLYRSWGQIDGDDLHLPFFRGQCCYSFREVARPAAGIKNT